MKRLVTSTTGVAALSRHSASSIVTPYFPSPATSARAAFPDQELPMVLCQSLSRISGNGTQARDTPFGHSSSTRVTVL